MSNNKNSHNKKTKNVFLLIVVSGLISLALYHLDFLTNIENTIHEHEAYLTTQQYDSDIVIIEIDPFSLRELPGWPWPRRYYAKAINTLVDAKVKNIFLDIGFNAASNIEDDNILRNTLKSVPSGTVLMPVFLQYSDSSQNKFLILNKPNEKFIHHVTPVSVNLNTDEDGLVRRIKLLSEFAGERIPTAAILFNQYKASLNETIKLDFRVDPNSFKRIPFHQIYNGTFNAKELKGKYIIIGATALELSDQIPVPVHQSIAGPIVQAIAYQTIKNGILVHPDKKTTILFLILFSIPVWALLKTHAWRIGLLYLLGINIFLVITSFIAHVKFNLLLDVTPFLLFSSISYLLIQFARIDKQLYLIIRQKTALQKKEDMMTHVIDNTSEGIILLNEKLVITKANDAAIKIFFTEENSLVDQDIQSLLPDLNIHNVTNNDKKIETVAIHQQKNKVPVALTVNQLRLNNEYLYTIFIHDITERKKQEAILSYQASHDSLTGLLNRRLLSNHIDDAIVAFKLFNKKATMILIDLNNFKEINDTLGHHTGDQLLIILGERLSSLDDQHTFVARLGGDEFGILKTSTKTNDSIHEFIEKIQTLISTPIEVSDMSLTIDAAIGIAYIPEHAQTTNELLIASDVAMYSSKTNNLVYSIYTPESDYNTKRNLTISSDIKHALTDNQFEVFYQPKINFKSGEVSSLEALIRWQHPELGLIGPDEFIPIIENSTLIKPVTLFVIKQAITKQKELFVTGNHLSIAINLSAKLLDDNSISKDINKLLQIHQSSADSLILEITESAAMSQNEQTLSILQDFTQNNFKLSIDDFGTSHASFSYLKQLPASELKIDKLFITNICHDESDKIITSSIITLAHGLGMSVVAEGIEDEQTFEHLNSLGCDIAQGYWISKPIPGKEINKWIENWENCSKLTTEQIRNIQ